MSRHRLFGSVRVLFVPALAVMNRLSYARKFILTALILAGPLAIVAHLQSSGASEHIEFTREERAGIALLRPTSDLLDAVQRHRLLAAAVSSGAADQRPALAASAAEAEAALGRAERATGEFEALAHSDLAEAWRTIRERWRRIATQPLDDAASQAEHAALARCLLDLLLDRVGDESNLILDPESDSYWLADALLVRIPELSDTVAHVGATALSPPAEGESGWRRAIALGAGRERAQSMAQGLAGLALRATARASRPPGRRTSLEVSISEPLREAVLAVEEQAQILDQEEPRDAPLSRGPEIVRRGLAALARLHALGERIAPELDALLERRVRTFQTQRAVGLAASGGIALVLAYLFIAISLSVRESMRELEGAADSGLGTPERFAAPGQDEFVQLAAAYSRARGEQAALQEKLRLADKLATIGQLAAGTAHELNEPIAAILGFAELAQGCTGVPEQAARDLNKIARSALHARDIIKQLLLFARQTPLRREPTDLNQIVAEGLEVLEPRCERSGVGLLRELAPRLPCVEGDGHRLRQVVVNLVANAVQASSAGGQVKVITAAREGGVLFAVEDHGCGMTEEVRRHLFLPFYTNKEVGQGSGLGLSVVHGIVTAHGGTIQVDSAPERGTRIEVRLPTSARVAAAAG